MLASPATIGTVVEALKRHRVPKIVVDPVMIATSGAELLPRDAVAELLEGLLKVTTVLTPNIPEAKLLLQDAGFEGAEVASVADLEEMARKVKGLGPEWVLVKGGHAPFKADFTVAKTEEEKEVVVDVLYGEGGFVRIESPGRFIEYMLARPDVKDVWSEFVYHPFVMAMGDGTLPLESFKKYLIQDYLYLVHFARANSLASYKAKNIADISAGASIVSHIAREMSLHIDYCKGFGITVPEIEATEEHQACTAYTRYVLDVGQSEDWIALQMALAPCLLGYGAVAKQLHGDVKTKRDDNTYWKWIENYVADDYVQAVKTGSELIERHAVLQSPSSIERLIKIFIHGTKVSPAEVEASGP
ncbi:hypothetical protein COL154_004825 [Colletotrichum chrysophilum]|nr:hypothetical protein COL154_004825 [Colletotrichum chrysophilum]